MDSCILALDCATGPTSVAVWKGSKIAAYSENLASTMQSKTLVPMIEQTLKQSGISYSDLTAVACTTGPGSFTGIRVALATARGICFAAGISGLGFTTLEVLAFAVKQQKTVTAALNAGKGEWYYQSFQNGKAQSEPKVAAPETVTKLGGFLVGNVPGAALATFPRADTLAELAATQLASSTLTPFYIRLPDAIPSVKI